MRLKSATYKEYDCSEENMRIFYSDRKNKVIFKFLYTPNDHKSGVKFRKIVLDHAQYLVQDRSTHVEIMQTLKIRRCAALRLSNCEKSHAKFRLNSVAQCSDTLKQKVMVYIK